MDIKGGKENKEKKTPEKTTKDLGILIFEL